MENDEKTVRAKLQLQLLEAIKARLTVTFYINAEWR